MPPQWSVDFYNEQDAVVSDRFDGIDVFVTAAEAGGFAKAAQRLSLSRSAVGKSIARLEQRLGVRLFNRTTRSQSMTEDGQVYYERCLRAIAELRGAEDMIGSGQRKVTGILRVSMPVLFGRHCVAPVLLAYAQKFPDLELDLSFNDRPIDLLAERFDLAIRIGSLDMTGELKARRLLKLRFVLCASPAYLRRHSLPGSPVDLAEHDLLVYCRNGHPMPWQLPDESGVISGYAPGSRLRFDHLEAVADAAAAGAGLTWLPRWLVQERLANGTLVEIWNDRPSAAMDCYALWPATKYLPLRTRYAIDALVKEFARETQPLRLNSPER